MLPKRLKFEAPRAVGAIGGVIAPTFAWDWCADGVCLCWHAQVGEIVKEVFQKEPSRGVNPDEVVALGAAIQVGALQAPCQSSLLVQTSSAACACHTGQGGKLW